MAGRGGCLGNEEQEGRVLSHGNGCQREPASKHPTLPGCVPSISKKRKQSESKLVEGRKIRDLDRTCQASILDR